MREKCVVIANAVDESGRREVIGLDIGEAETEAFWREVLGTLRAPGVTGVRSCVSDRASNPTEPRFGSGPAGLSGRALTIGASPTFEPGEGADPTVILSWTAAAP